MDSGSLIELHYGFGDRIEILKLLRDLQVWDAGKHTYYIANICFHRIRRKLMPFLIESSVTVAFAEFS
jgi:hypothetical protein